MIETKTEEVNHCTCDVCGWKWRSLVVPVMCPHPDCRTKTWNGKRVLGRPPKPKTEAKIVPAKARNTASRRAELPEYAESKW